jgi:hypothetical protein
MAKVVQTVLQNEEYKTFRELLWKRRLTVKEGLHLAVTRLLQEEMTIDSADSFLARRPTGRSGRKDLSIGHDRYLYEKAHA